jgi:hypothetical protein
MSTAHYFALFVVLLVSFCNAASTDVNQTIDSSSAIVIHTAVNTPVHYNCGPGETFVIVDQSGATRTIGVNFDADTNCHATWNSLEGTFIARDVRYDRTHIFIYWSVRPDGFYHSWDEINYEKKFDWNH